MAKWLEQLGKVEFQDGRKLIGASFRGVPFFVETAEREGGRRTVRHEFPLRDRPFIEDMGRQARSYPVEGYVIGEAYISRRDSLIAALELPGPAELVHPYYGTLRAACTRFRVRESTSDGGMARFAIEFEETEPASSYPDETFDAEAVVAASSDAAWAQKIAEFTAKYHVDGQPASALASLSAVVSSAAAALDAALAPLVQSAQDLALLKKDLNDLVLDASALARAPLDLVATLGTMFSTLASLPLTAGQGVQALLAAYGFTPSVARPPATTATRIQEQANYDALLGMVRSLAVIQAARIAPTQQYDSYDAAAALRDAIGEKLDELADSAGDDSYGALVQLRADLVRAVPGEKSDLPRLVRYTPAYTVPSLVLAHQLYGDLSREADIVARNQVNRPGFIPGAAQLEVLSA